MVTPFVQINIATVSPYGFEVNNILGLPDGFSYRVRYRRRWVAFADPLTMEGCDGIINLRCIGASENEFVPLRKVKIAKVLLIGALVYVELVLGSLIEFSSIEELRQKQLKDFNNLMANILETQVSRDGSRRTGIIPATDTTFAISDTEFGGDAITRHLNAWGTLIEILGGLEFYQDYDFLKVVNIVDGDNNPVSVHKDRNGSAFPLNNGANYALDVLQIVPFSTVTRHLRQEDGRMHYPPITHKELLIETNPEEVDFVAENVFISSRADLHRFRFRVAETYRGKNSSLALVLKHHSDQELALIVSRLVLPLRISVSKLKQTTRVVGLVLFVVAGFIVLAPELAGRIIPSIPFTSQTGGLSLIQRFAIVVMVMTSWTFPRAEKWISNLFGV